MEDPITTFVTRGRCPFLSGIQKTQGLEMARKMAVNPLVPAAMHQPRSLTDEADDMIRTFQLFHGPSGVLPLPGVGAEQVSKKPLAQGCPFQHHAQVVPHSANSVLEKQVPSSAEVGATKQHQLGKCPFPHHGLSQTGAPTQHMSNSLDSNGAVTGPGAFPHSTQPAKVPVGLPPLPLASLSLGAGWPDFRAFFFQPKPKPKPRKSDGPKPQQRFNSSAGASPTSMPLNTGGPAAGSIGPSSAAPAGGSCPLRKWLGPLSGVVFNKQGHLSCPEPIVKMRAALAATKPVRELRPQALHVKFAAMGLTTALLNIPCGMWREHTEKFSFGWFVAVHATIPFIAMLRKAVIMPKYAILFTIAAAIAGQSIGAKYERKRLKAALETATTSIAAAPPQAAAKLKVSSKASSARSTAPPVASLSLSMLPGATDRVPSSVQRAKRASFVDLQPTDDLLRAAPAHSITSLWLNRPIDVTC